MTEGMTCYERDETLCEDQMCLRVGCRIRNERLSPPSSSQPSTETPRHTPTPWRVFTNPDGTKLVGVGGQDGVGILDCGFGVWSWSDPEGIANANLVVEAVNSHATLTARVEDLEKALRMIEGGSFGGAASLAIDGAWQQFVDELQKIARAALALPQPREAFADEIKRADAGHPITNPLVLPAGIKAGDYASPSPIPEAPGGRENIVEQMAKWLHDETAHPDSYPSHTWPETERDDGQREGGFVKIVPSHGQAYFRDIARRLVARFVRALKPQHGGNCEHGIAKVNCGICVPSKVFSKPQDGRESGR